MAEENVGANPFSGLFSPVTDVNQPQVPKDVATSSNTTFLSDIVEMNPDNMGSQAGKAKSDISKVNAMVETVFYFTMNPNAIAPSVNKHKESAIQLVYLDELAASEAPKTEIDLDILEQALFERLLLPDPSNHVIPKDCKNHMEHVVQKKVLVYLFNAEQNLRAYAGCKDQCEKTAISKMRELILRNAVTALRQPELFEGQNLSKQIVELFKELDASFHTFLMDMLRGYLAEDDPDLLEQLKAVMKPVLLEMHKDVAKASLISLDLYIFPALQLFASNGLLAYILLETCVPSSSTKTGRGYQETLIGGLLSLSALPKLQHARHEYFDTPLDQSANSLTEGRLWTASEHLVDNLHKIFLALLKCSPDTKDCILKWLAGCINTNAHRGKIWNSQIADMNAASLTCVSDGFMMNLSAVLLKLCQPFCSAYNDPKSLKIDATYCAVEIGSRAEKNVHLKGLHEETCIVPPREVAEGASAPPRPSANTYNFLTECFFMAHKALDLSYRVAVDKLSKLSQDLNRAQRAYSEATISGTTDVAEALRERIQLDMTKYVTLRCVLLEPQYVSLLAKLHAVTCNWLVQVAIHQFPPNANPDTYAPMTTLELKFPLSNEIPDTLRCVPEFVIENIVGFVSTLRRFVPAMLEERATSLLKPALSFVLVFMGSAERMRNPHQRARLAECLEALLPNHPDDEQTMSSIGSFYRESLFKEHPHRLQIVPSLLDVFVGIEVTGQSVQFEQKFNYRRPMYLVMDFLWKIEEHRNCFKRLSDEAEANMEAVTPPIFLRFVNLLMNDAVFLLDEALTNMAQIRTMQAARENNEWATLPAQERDQNITSLHHTGMIARFDNILGRDTIQALERLTGHVKSVFCHPTMVDRVASMLNYFLLHLVGPNQKNLKVKDSKEFEFDPGATVLDICRIYVHLSDNEGFCLAVSQDGRSYSPQLFKLAEDVLVRIRGGELIGSLQVVAERVASLARRQMEDEIALADAPDEYLDPIMSTLMMDPVILPSSRTTVDRTTIARHLLSDQSDPFNRSPLSMDQVKPDDELRAKIHQWIAQRRKGHMEASSSNIQ